MVKTEETYLMHLHEKQQKTHCSIWCI